MTMSEFVSPLTGPAAFKIGSTVDCYEFLEVLSHGDNSVSYKVRNIVARRFELLKVLAWHSEYSLEGEERFLREVNVHARLVHPNIVRFYNAAILQERLVMTTEFVEGVTLARRLASGPMSWEEGFECASQVLTALGCAHSHAVMHRHITPNNIVLALSGPVKLTGFDLAKGLKDKKLTALGVIVGDTRYMSPEQVEGQPLCDITSDIYSLGVVLYQTVTGAPLFESKSQFELMHAHLKTIPAPPSRINHSLPPEVDRVILKALEKEPAKRFQSPDEFRAAITSVRVSGPAPTEQVQHCKPVLQMSPPKVPALPLFAEVPSSSKVTIIAALVLIAVIVVVALRL